MPRIVHVIDAPEGIGGAERITAALATAQQSGWEQTVVNIGGANPTLAAACAPVGIQHPPRPWLALGRSKLRTVVRNFEADLVHAHLPRAMLLVASMARGAGVARVATHHHGDRFVRSARGLALQLDRVAGRRFDAVVAPSEAVQRLLVRTYAYAPEKVWTISNGWGGAGVGAPWARERPKDPIAVSVANFRPEKNHNLLLDAFALVRAELPRARLVLVGGGPGESAVRERVRTLGLETAVDFTGYVDDVWPFLARSRLFALASSYEPQGMAVLEAMAAGLPVVATAVGGLRESVTPGLTGELVDPVDVSAMAAAMVRILSSDSVAEAMGAAARASAQEHTAERMIEEYFELYDRLLAGRSTSRDGAVGPSRLR